ncbi:MAG: GCN5-related N-acetyltransferase [Clostridiaceae bacterium]|jgi:ribosomal protein S18 acetylase RimI-like enzyme|nr:GCN5-related N-acetyltransferase [Clostridiaceae bacterium]
MKTAALIFYIREVEINMKIRVTYHTAVKAEYRGQGIGTKLLEAVYAALAKEGITKAELVVFTNNEIENSFWKSKGWKKRMDLNYFNKSLNSDNK